MFLVVVVAACFALPALLAGWLARWWAARTWDYRERWSGIWAFAVTLGAIYTLIMWCADPLPFPLKTWYERQKNSPPGSEPSFELFS